MELKSLKLYLWSFRNDGIFYERAVNRILDDLAAAVQAEVDGGGGGLQRARRDQVGRSRRGGRWRGVRRPHVSGGGACVGQRSDSSSGARARWARRARRRAPRGRPVRAAPEPRDAAPRRGPPRRTTRGGTEQRVRRARGGRRTRGEPLDPLAEAPRGRPTGAVRRTPRSAARCTTSHRRPTPTRGSDVVRRSSSSTRRRSAAGAGSCAARCQARRASAVRRARRGSSGSDVRAARPAARARRRVSAARGGSSSCTRAAASRRSGAAAGARSGARSSARAKLARRALQRRVVRPRARHERADVAREPAARPERPALGGREPRGVGVALGGPPGRVGGGGGGRERRARAHLRDLRVDVGERAAGAPCCGGRAASATSPNASANAAMSGNRSRGRFGQRTSQHTLHRRPPQPGLREGARGIPRSSAGARAHAQPAARGTAGRPRGGTAA